MRLWGVLLAPIKDSAIREAGSVCKAPSACKMYTAGGESKHRLENRTTSLLPCSSKLKTGGMWLKGLRTFSTIKLREKSK